MVTEKQIEELAYTIWVEKGRPEGKDLEHYFRAKQILEERQTSSLIELALSPVADVLPGQYKHRRHTHH